MLNRRRDRILLIACLILCGLSAFFFYKVYEENQLIDKFIHESLDRTRLQDRPYVATALATAIYAQTKHIIDPDRLDWYDRLESTCLAPASIFHLTAGVCLKYKGYGLKGQKNLGPCGTMSRVLLNALWRLDIPARALFLLNNPQGQGGGHTMVEFWDGGRWRVVSPADTAHTWRNKPGEIATAREIQQDPEIFRQIYEVRANYDYLFDNYRHISFEVFPDVIPKALKIILGPESFERLEAPKLFDRPRVWLAILAAALAVLCGIGAVVVKYRDSKGR
jgi:hypothetical protein